ncbi:MAG: hypothetical protein GY723_07075 [bacterium]|nr:hypothetical protein [bacterium]MCP5064992.1 hypothetical protein [bacterium]
MAGRIKGAALAGSVEELCGLRDEGRLSQEQLEFSLQAEDLELLEGKVDPAVWYPIHIAERIVLLLFEVDGGGRIGYLRKRGRLAAERLIASGHYPQLDALSGPGATTLGELRMLMRQAIRVHDALFDVGRWSVDADERHPARLKVTIEDAAEFPESMRHNVEGFFTRACEEARLDSNWLSERPRPDLLIYRMDADFQTAPTPSTSGG